MSDVTAVETVPEELQRALTTMGLAPESARQLMGAFAPHFSDFNDVEPFAVGCPQDKPDVAREHRLKLRRVRVAAEHTRKGMKDESLRYGQACDRIYRLLEDRIKPLEASLDQIERAKEIAEAKRIAELVVARGEAIAPFVAFVSPADIANLGALTQMQFDALLDRARSSHEAEQERIAAEEAVRLERERQEREERERIRQENERLRAERAEMDRRWELLAPCAGFVTAMDRGLVPGMDDGEFDAFLAHCLSLQAAHDAEKAQEEARRIALEEALRAQADKERRERERLQAEARAREDAERQAEAARVAEARRLAAAPDKEKLLAFAATVRELPSPECETEAGCAIVADLDTMIERFAQVIERKAAELDRGF